MSSTSVVEEGYKTDKTFTTIGSLESYSSHWTKWSDDDYEEPEPSRPLSEEDKRMRPLLRHFSFQGKSLPKTFDDGLPQQQPQPLAISSSSHTYHDLSHRPVPHEIFDNATSPLYDGLYPLNEKLCALMRRSATNDKITLRVDETV
ncbi:hypothetical protein PQX77_018229 [Marasmius sp. AFHP31]|nr:hypothetical protein PQX77_018229 [Marasmius sp. AFHP31]